jgi:5-methylcytosine-specific restriction endonuclease McrA
MVREGLRAEKVRLSTYFGLKNDTKQVPPWMRAEVLNLFGNKCAGCGRPLAAGAATMDHIMPLSRGGLTEVGNLQPLCVGCNGKKADQNVKVVEVLLRFPFLPPPDNVEGAIW